MPQRAHVKILEIPKIFFRTKIFHKRFVHGKQTVVHAYVIDMTSTRSSVVNGFDQVQYVCG